MVVGDYESGMSEWRMVIEGSQVKIGLLMNPNFTYGDLLVTLRTEKFKLALATTWRHHHTKLSSSGIW